MTEVLKISDDIKSQHKERVSQKVDAINSSIKEAIDNGMYFTDFRVLREDPDYSEIRDMYKREGYHFKHKENRWTGSTWVQTEYICW